MLAIQEEAYNAWKNSFNDILADATEENAAQTETYTALKMKVAELDEQLTRARADSKDATTQVCTVTGVCLTSQIFRRCRAEQAASNLSRTVGRIAALNHELCTQMGVLLDLAVVGTTASAPLQREHGDVGALRPRYQQPEKDANEVLSLLSPSVVAALCSTSRAFRNKVSSAKHDRSTTSSDAQDFLRKRLEKRFQQAHAFFQERQNAMEQEACRENCTGRTSSGRDEASAFLCWRCRQDGRQNYLFGSENRPLPKTVDTTSTANGKNSPKI